LHTEGIFEQVRELGVKLLLAVFLTDSREKELNILEKTIEENKNCIEGIVVFKEGEKVIPEGLLRYVRSRLVRFGIPVGSGTDAFFTQINRQRLPGDLMDFVCSSNNPQVHAFDNDSIMSTVEGQAANLSSCAHLYPKLPVWVTPVTLKMRWNPDATGEAIIRKGEIPPDTDIRQMSLFTASWFLRSLASCLLGGALGATYFELTGCKGIMEEESPSRDFLFPSAPDMLYPVYFAFLAVRGLKEADTSVQIAEDVTSFVMRNGGRTRIILANPRDERVKLRLDDVPSSVRGIMIDEHSAPKLAGAKLVSDLRDYFESYNLNGEILMESYSIFIAEI